MRGFAGLKAGRLQALLRFLGDEVVVQDFV
jgi:hypothetical protein